MYESEGEESTIRCTQTEGKYSPSCTIIIKQMHKIAHNQQLLSRFISEIISLKKTYNSLQAKSTLLFLRFISQRSKSRLRLETQITNLIIFEINKITNQIYLQFMDKVSSNKLINNNMQMATWNHRLHQRQRGMYYQGQRHPDEETPR